LYLNVENFFKIKRAILIPFANYVYGSGLYDIVITLYKPGDMHSSSKYNFVRGYVRRR